MKNIVVNKLTENSIIPVDENGFWQDRKPPEMSLNITARLLNDNNGSNIVEIGTGIHGGLAGNSMLTWVSKTNAKNIFAVDLDEDRINEVKQATKGCNNVHLVLGDGIEFLEQYQDLIDLLYLDFWVPDKASQLVGTGRAEAYSAMYAAARDKMRKSSIILIDDTDHIHPWKHTLIVPEARKDGYAVLYTGRQTLLMRNIVGARPLTF